MDTVNLTKFSLDMYSSKYSCMPHLISFNKLPRMTDYECDYEYVKPYYSNLWKQLNSDSANRVFSVFKCCNMEDCREDMFRP